MIRVAGQALLLEVGEMANLALGRGIALGVALRGEAGLLVMGIEALGVCGGGHKAEWC